jgi:hypothetical protein
LSPFGVGLSPFGLSPFGVGLSPFGLSPFGVGLSPFGLSPFGVSAFGVRGPFIGGVGVIPPIAPVLPVAPVIPVAPVAPVTVVHQTVLNPAPAPLPYTAAYLARIPLGLPTLAVGGTNYYYTQLLPPGAQPTTVGGAHYFASNGVTYQPYFLGAQTVYLVVEL